MATRAIWAVVFMVFLVAGCATAVPLVASQPASVTDAIEFLGLKASGDTIDGEVVRRYLRYGTLVERPRMKIESGTLRGEGGAPAFEFRLKMYDVGSGNLELRGPFSIFWEGRVREGEIRVRKER